MQQKETHNISMSFYGFIEKTEFDCLIKKARQSCMEDAMEKLKKFDAMNEDFFRAAMPEGTIEPVIKKRTNKLMRKKRAKELKRYLGYS